MQHIIQIRKGASLLAKATEADYTETLIRLLEQIRINDIFVSFDRGNLAIGRDDFDKIANTF